MGNLTIFSDHSPVVDSVICMNRPKWLWNLPSRKQSATRNNLTVLYLCDFRMGRHRFEARPSYEHLAEFSSVKNWLLGFNYDTARGYLRHLGWFSEYTKKNPDQLIEWAKIDRTVVHMTVKEFYRKLADRGVSTNSRKHAYLTVRSFFHHNDNSLGKIPRMIRSQFKMFPTKLLSPREIFDLIGAATTLRGKAVISCLAQSGQRVGVLANLRYGSVRKQIEQGQTPVVIDYTSGYSDDLEAGYNKGHSDYKFAIGKECVSYIIQMMNRRKSDGETISDDSWLFRANGKYDRDASGKWGVHQFEKGIDGPRIGHPQFLSWTVDRAAFRAGIQSVTEIPPGSPGNKPRRIHEIRSAIFRTFWKHQMREAGVNDSDLLWYMIGHRPKYDGAYDRFDTEYVRREYARAEPLLSVMSFQAQSSPSSNQSDRSGEPQRIVPETELAGYLSQGWRYVTTLPSGQILIG